MVRKVRRKGINLFMVGEDFNIPEDGKSAKFKGFKSNKDSVIHGKAMMTEGMSDKDKEQFLSNYEKAKRYVEERSKEFSETVFGKGGKHSDI